MNLAIANNTSSRPSSFVNDNDGGCDEVVMLKVKTLAPERRRPSSISFEKHNLFLADRLDDDFFSDFDFDDEEDEDNEHHRNGGSSRRKRTAEPRSHNDKPQQQEEDFTHHPLSSGGYIEVNSRCNDNVDPDASSVDFDASIDLNDLASSLQGSSNNSASLNRRTSSSSIMSQIEDGIIAKAINDGKIANRRGHWSWSGGRGEGGGLFSSSSLLRSQQFSFPSFRSDSVLGSVLEEEPTRPSSRRASSVTSSKVDDENEDAALLEKKAYAAGFFSRCSAQVAAALAARSPRPRGAMPSRSALKKNQVGRLS